MFAKICGNVCKESFSLCLLISPGIWFGVYHFADISKMIGKKKGEAYRLPLFAHRLLIARAISRLKSSSLDAKSRSVILGVMPSVSISTTWVFFTLLFIVTSTV